MSRCRFSHTGGLAAGAAAAGAVSRKISRAVSSVMHDNAFMLSVWPGTVAPPAANRPAPPGFSKRFEHLTQGTVAPLPSATVMILRDGSEGPQVLLGRRRQGRAFGEAYVFPGGVVDADDQRTAQLCRGLSSAQACRCLSLEQGGLEYWAAAVREVFEETGLAFLGGSPGSLQQLSPLRLRLLGGDLPFSQLCADRNLFPQLRELYYVAHWITPEVRPVRFDTRFFIAALPPGQHAAHDGVELTDSIWLTPASALARMRAGEIKLAPPTIVELERLSRFPRVAEAVAWARDCWRSGVSTILPVVEQHGEKERMHLPAEPAAALQRATREHD